MGKRNGGLVMKTLVIGASTNPDRYAYKTVSLLKSKQHEVIPLGVKPGEIEGVPIVTEKHTFSTIHTISLYVGPSRQEKYLDYMISLQPQRVIFNPGTENEGIEKALEEKGIYTERACTLVLLSTNQYESNKGN